MIRFRHADTRLLVVLLLAYGLVAAAAALLAPQAAVLVAVGLAAAFVLGLQLHLFRSRQDDDRAHREHVQALLWLNARLAPGRPLPPLTGWAASPQLASEVVALVEAHRPALVVEVGSGASTLVAAYALERAGAGRIVSLEAEADYADATRRLLARHGLAHRATVVHAPLGPVPVEGETWQWYDVDALARALDGAGAVDLLVVDGPPSQLQRLARYPALPLLRDRLSAHAVVVLDDADRPDERAIVQRWRAMGPGYDAEPVPSPKGVVVLRPRPAAA